MASPRDLQFIVAAPRSAAAGAVDVLRYLGGSQRVWTAPNVVTAVRTGSYAVEALITAVDMDMPSWTLSGSVGLDLAIGVSGTGTVRCGHQVGQYFLRVDPAGGSCAGEPWCDASAFCLPMLDPPP